MCDLNQGSISNAKEEGTLQKAGFCSAVLLVLITIITFGTAVFTPPISGPFSTVQGTAYPYADIISRFPRDYYWMYPAMLLMLVYVFFILTIDLYASGSKQIFSRVSLILSCMSACILTVNYYIQVFVVQSSLINGEFEGIALLTQYNPHGLFIAAEEIGYIFMALSILLLAPVFSGHKPVQKAIRWTAVLCFALTLISFVLMSVMYGIEREYRFECAVIAIDWISLILLGIFTGILFRRGMASGK